MLRIYGIRNCDTMKKAFAWLDAQGLAYELHDYKKAGIDGARLGAWSKQVGWKTLLNTRGTTWRKLDAAQQADLDEARAISLMREHPSLIRRPVLEHGGSLLVGFDEARYAGLLASAARPRPPGQG